MKKRNKIIIRLVSTLAVMLCVTGVTHIQAKNVYAKKTITMTTKSIPSEIKKYSNYNKYTKYTVAFNYYMKQLEKAGGGKFIIKKGTYEMSNSVYIPSNVQVVLKNGVVLKNIYQTGGAGYPPSNNVFSLCPPSKSKIKGSCKKVSGAKNISITGKGNATIDNNFVEGGGTIVISHNKNVKVSGITFKNQNGGHFLEITGVENVVIENCTFKGSKASTRAKNYMKEAINLDTPDPETHGLNAVWVAQDRTDNKNITITNNVFDGVTRGVGTHKYSQKNGENVYHENVVITNNTFKNIFDNGVFILNWKNATIENNTFNKIGLKSKKTYSSGAHAISGGGIEGIHVKNNIFSNVKRNPIYFCVQQNVGSASSYSKVKTNITKEQTEEMLTNTVSNCGYDMNVIFKGYDILYFRGNSERTRENAVAINLKKQEISWGIEK